MNSSAYSGATSAKISVLVWRFLVKHQNSPLTAAETGSFLQPSVKFLILLPLDIIRIACYGVSYYEYSSSNMAF